MIGRRTKPDGLPFRLYVRAGKRKTTFFYRHRDNTQEKLAEARTVNKAEVHEARQRAVARATELNTGAPARGSVSELIEQYFSWQDALPFDSEMRKARSTLDENKREAKNLTKFFGAMAPEAVLPKHCYAYQDARISMNAGAKANKELALFSAVFEFARRKGWIETNPCRGIKRVPVKPRTYLLNENDLMFALDMARKLGGSYLIQALAAQVCWLTVRRPSEILALSRQQITDDGILFTAAKRKAGQAEIRGLITWSPALRAAIDESLAVKRQRVAGTFLVFGNQAGQRYTKSGWGAIWRRLMDHCEREAVEQGKTFTRFTLADCRPRGVTDKQARGDSDTQDATLHSDGRMIAAHYDRRRVRVAKPAK